MTFISLKLNWNPDGSAEIREPRLDNLMIGENIIVKGKEESIPAIANPFQRQFVNVRVSSNNLVGIAIDQYLHREFSRQIAKIYHETKERSLSRARKRRA